MAELQFRDTAAAGYDRSIGVMTRRVVPLLLRAARLAPGQRVLDIAAGTGLAAEAAEAVGPTGHVLAADISPAMVARARERLGGRPNVSFAVEDAQALALAGQGFDAVICNLGLMYLPDPARPRRVPPSAAAGFRDVEVLMETRRFSFPSFDAYFEPFEQGGGPWGAEYAALTAEERRAVREEVRRALERETASDGTVRIDVDIHFGGGTK